MRKNIKKKNNRKETIERLKTEFVSLAAHQLRTPLSAIKWILRILLDNDTEKLTKQQIELLEMAYQSNERMIILINDLLDVTQIEEGRFLFKKKQASLNKIIEDNIAKHKKLIKSKKINILFQEPKKDTPEIKIDTEKINLVIEHILENAIRYTPEDGEIIVSIACDGKHIKTTIKDSGIGIPKEQQKRVFEKFFRADNAIKTETEGTGLGLFICKNIIEAHNGKIWFKSKKGKGTTFWFTLPIK